MNAKFHIKSKGTLSVLRPVNNIAVFVHEAHEYGINPKDILAGSGISMSDLVDPHRLITTAQEIMIGRKMVQLAPASVNGFDMGPKLHLISKGKLGMAAMCCDTALDALKMMITYIDLTSTYFQYDLTVENEKGSVHMKELVNLDDFRLYVFETEIVSLYTICAMILDDVHVFKEMRVAFPAPDYAARYKEIFHCPVYFDAPGHLILFDATLLHKPLKHANPLIRKVLEQECCQLCQRLNEHATVKDKIRHELMFAEDTFPTLDQLAQRINMPERTIRRKLTMEGTSYKDILSDIRKHKALELIAAGDLSMEKIAEKLGYSEVASFYHAFKTWTGTTPANYRAKK